MHLDIPTFKDYGEEASPLTALFTKNGVRTILGLYRPLCMYACRFNRAHTRFYVRLQAVLTYLGLIL